MTEYVQCDESRPFHFLGVWEETWQARATQAWNAERYFTRLRQQGCSRDEAAALVVQSLTKTPHITVPLHSEHLNVRQRRYADTREKEERPMIEQNVPTPGEDTLAEMYVEGTPVFDSQGKKVGVVGKPAVLGNSLVIEKGWLFPSNLYIPFSAVHARDANGVYLNVTKEELKDDQWKNPPGGAEVQSTIPDQPPIAPADPIQGVLGGGILPGPVVTDSITKR